MKINMLGTGNATVKKCYNTCFTIENNDDYLLVDGGGGNNILRILDESDIPLSKIHNIFVSHAHTDHIFGVIWVIRMIGQQMLQDKYKGNLTIYCHDEVSETILTICKMVLTSKLFSLFNTRIQIKVLQNGDTFHAIGNEFKVFDIQSTKMKQFGFIMNYDGDRRFVFSGDEPLAKHLEASAFRADWLLHEAFCLYSERDTFKPYEKSHSTVKDACELAEKLQCKNLLLYHTEDKNILNRKELYYKEGSPFYSGNLYIPDDGEIIGIV